MYELCIQTDFFTREFKPMMKVLPGSRNKTGQQQGNQNKGRGSQKNQRGRGGRNQQNKSGMFSCQINNP
jgi:hypothetical protein